MKKYTFRLYISVSSRNDTILKEFTIKAKTKDEAERKANEWIDANPTNGGLIKLVEIV